jgi:hypothetical protein
MLTKPDNLTTLIPPQEGNTCYNQLIVNFFLKLLESINTNQYLHNIIIVAYLNRDYYEALLLGTHYYAIFTILLSLCAISDVALLRHCLKTFEALAEQEIVASYLKEVSRDTLKHLEDFVSKVIYLLVNVRPVAGACFATLGTFAEIKYLTSILYLIV